MKINCHFASKETELSLNQGKPTETPLLQKWLAVRLPTTVLCVQDMVHIAVKLKCRLLKPSIILPTGAYIASSAHLQILVKLIGKDKHGIRARDLDFKDKQNFAAVEHLFMASNLLNDFPDALGTKYCLEVSKAAVYSYLDKSISPEQCLEDILHATFFQILAPVNTITKKIHTEKQLYNI